MQDTDAIIKTTSVLSHSSATSGNVIHSVLNVKKDGRPDACQTVYKDANLLCLQEVAVGDDVEKEEGTRVVPGIGVVGDLTSETIGVKRAVECPRNSSLPLHENAVVDKESVSGKERDVDDCTATVVAQDSLLLMEEKSSSKKVQKQQQQQRQKTNLSASEPHRVFTAEEFAAYQQQREQENQKKYEVLNNQFSRRTFYRDGSVRSRGNTSCMSSVLFPFAGNTRHTAPILQTQHHHHQHYHQPALYVPGVAHHHQHRPGGAMPCPLPYQVTCAGTSLQASGLEMFQPAPHSLPPPPPPPYPHVVATNIPLHMNTGLRAPVQQQQQQQQPGAFCGPWGFQMPLQSQCVGLPYPCGSQPIVCVEQQHKQEQQHGGCGGSAAAPQALSPTTGSVAELDMEELKVLAQLIVEQKKQKKQQECFIQQKLKTPLKQHYCNQYSEEQNVSLLNTLAFAQDIQVEQTPYQKQKKLQEDNNCLTTTTKVGDFEKETGVISILEQNNNES